VTLGHIGHLLNARRRHRLVHIDAVAEILARNGCSTPEGVIVWFTARKRPPNPFVQGAAGHGSASHRVELTPLQGD
ncbi:MAG: hypothetical protein M3456_02580, partial [Actinomycetota bacterium]|nr:hypothetical protein [Actinomycetota bacterium]